MKIYDITQELFAGRVYPGDPTPEYERLHSIAGGELYNLTRLSMGVHNATHLDAPYHFYENGKTIDQIDLSRCIGPCTVISLSDNKEQKLKDVLKTCKKRLLIKGKTEVTLEMAKLFNQYGIVLVGVEGQSVGPVEAPAPVHYELLGQEVVLLEGLVLEEIQEGDYFLSAAPLKLGGCDGSPCRAILMDFSESTCIYS